MVAQTLRVPIDRCTYTGFTRDMNTTQRITKTAQALGYTVTSEFGGELVARNAEGVAMMSATILDGRFHGGYTTDRMGHVVSHSTVRDFIKYAA